MNRKVIAGEKDRVQRHLPWKLYPMEYALSDLKTYREYLEEYVLSNIQPIEDSIQAASRQPIEVEVLLPDETVGKIMTSEREMAIDYYEDEHYEKDHLFRTFLLEGFIFKTHQQLDMIMHRLCDIVDEKNPGAFNQYTSAYRKREPDAPLLMIRGEYLQNILSPSNDPERPQFKALVKALERISIVRNCVTHEDNAIDNTNYAPKIRQFLKDNNCGELGQRGNRQIIIINYKYPEYLIKFIEELLEFMKRKLLIWLED